MTIRKIQGASIGAGLAVLFSASLAPALIQMATFHHALCQSGTMLFGEIIALHASGNPQFWPLIMLGSGLSVMAVAFIIRLGVTTALTKSGLAVMATPVLVAVACWIAQTMGASVAGHALLMTLGLLASVGIALGVPTRTISVTTARF